MIPNDLSSIEDAEQDANGGWFSRSGKTLDAFASSFARLAKEAIPTAGSAVKQTLDGIADAIQKSADSIASEFADMEREARDKTEREQMEVFMMQYMKEREKHSLNDFVECCKIAFSKLPWEVWRAVVTDDLTEEGGDAGGTSEKIILDSPFRRGEFVEDDILKEKILALSFDETTFTEPFLDAEDVMVMDENNQYDYDLDYDAQYCYFEKKGTQTEQLFVDRHAGSIRRLLEIDSRLATARANLVGECGGFSG